MHTNYDVLGMAELSEKVLGIHDTEVLDVTMEKEGKPEGIGRVGTLERPMTLEECCVYVKHRLNLGSLKVFGDMTARRCRGWPYRPAPERRPCRRPSQKARMSLSQEISGTMTGWTR